MHLSPERVLELRRRLFSDDDAKVADLLAVVRIPVSADSQRPNSIFGLGTQIDGIFFRRLLE
ncbi:MAG: hypothetical protein U1F61_24575 [Opitutaceae bacterium]